MQNIAKEIESLTSYMRRKESEIARQTRRLLTVGVEGAGIGYMACYNENLQLWQDAYTKREELKQSVK